MSYDITLSVEGDDGRPVYLRGVLDANYTYNITSMLTWAIGGHGIYELAGEPGSEAGPALRAAIFEMEADPATYKAMNPRNGWGDYEGCLEWLRTIAAACESHPTALLVVG